MKILDLLKALWDWSGYEIVSPKPKLITTGQISGNMAYLALSKRFPNAHIFISDGTFTTAPVSEVVKIINWSKVKDRKYLVETFDCDDFAFALQGAVSILPWSALPFGIIWTDKHALNLFIDDKQSIWFVEPQTYEIRETLDSVSDNDVQLVVM